MRLIGYILLVFLFSCEQKTKLPDPHEAGWKGEKVCEVLNETKKTRVLKCSFPPGVGHEKHFHAPHTGYTIKGSRFKMISEDGIVNIVDVKSGGSWSKTELSIHEVQNVGDSTAVFLIIEEK